MGKIFAILAALCNSCIGIFSSKLYDLGMNSASIAFFRCFFALIIISSFIINDTFRKELFNVTKKDIFQYAILSFLGIFIMYSFEILAVKFIPVSLVSFLLYSSGIITIILGCLFLNEKFNIKKLLSIIFVFVGVFLMFVTNLKVSGSILGLLSALCAGIGYSLYLILTKKFNVISSLKTLFYLFLFGSIYLFIPISINSNTNLNLSCIPYLLALSIVPTIAGFYCTNKALNLTDAGIVQLFEMTEPFFASILGYIILKQTITFYDLIAGILIVFGLFILDINNLITIIKSKTSK